MPWFRGKPIDEVLEMTEGYEIQQLREDRAATIHDVASFAKETGKDTVKNPLAISNRRNPKSHQKLASLLGFHQMSSETTGQM